MIRVFDMFAGYGGAEFGLKKAGISFECVGYSEIDKNAIKIFELNHPGIKNFGDCTKINPFELPDFDLLTGGFPCQDVSVAGRRDLNQNRTNLYKEILRVASVKKPKFMLLENVKGLLSVNKTDKICEPYINEIVRGLKGLGYGVCYKVLNSRSFGIPQNRERVWFVCKLGGWGFGEFVWPESVPLRVFVKDVLESVVDKKYFLSEKQVKKIVGLIRSKKDKYNIFQNKEYADNLSARDFKEPKVVALRGGRVPGELQNVEFNDDSICNSLTSQPKDNFLYVARPTHPDNSIGRIYDEYSPSLNNNPHPNMIPNVFMGCLTEATGCRGGSSDEFVNSVVTILGNAGVFRRLTPRECFRFMGFLQDEIRLDGLSDSALYKLAGNGWEVNVVSLLFKSLFRGVAL